MYTVLTILVIILAILMIVVVLLQPGKGDLSASFGGIGGQMGSMFGMQRTANILQKITRYIAIAILVIAFAINKFFLYDDAGTQQRVKTVLENTSAPEQRQPAPQVPGQQPEQPAQQQNPAQKEQTQAQPTQGQPAKTAQPVQQQPTQDKPAK